MLERRAVSSSFLRLGLALGASAIAACSLTSSVDDLSSGGQAGTGQPDGSVGNDAATDVSSEPVGDTLAEVVAESGQETGLEGGVETGADTAPDVECPVATKYCAGSCVGLNDPNTGCASADCAPCDFANASVICASGACAIGACVKDYDDCNGVATDGCESHLKTDPANCGQCGAGCVYPHTEPLCVAGSCTPGACDQGHEDCNGDKATDGCEVNTDSDPMNCGGCGDACPDKPGKTAICTAGVCSWSDCAAPTADCDSDPDTCETNTSSSLAHCGFCSNACVHANASSKCTAGVCELGTCVPGFGNCDTQASTGCETDLKTSVDNCSVCGKVCPARPNSTPQCSGSVCKPSCNVGWGNCNGLEADGCEVNVLTSTKHCGGCGNACPTGPYGSAQCVGGVCSLLCNAGRGDCNGIGTDGCEAILYSDERNCGTCGSDCCSGECNSGTCTPKPLYNGTGTGFGIAVNDTHVFVPQYSAFGSVRGIDKSTGNGTSLSIAQYARWITVDSNYAYWTENDGVMRVPLSGGSRKVLYSAASGKRPWGITLLGAEVFFTDNLGGTIMKVPAAGGTASTLASLQGAPMGIVALPGIPGNVYWANHAGTDIIGTATTDGTAPHVLLTGDAGAAWIATDGSSLFWTNDVTPGVWKVAIGGISKPTQLSATGSTPTCIAVNGPYVYWTDYGAGKINRVGKDGTGEKVIASSANPRGIAVDDKCVWWVQGSSGDVWGAPK